VVVVVVDDDDDVVVVVVVVVVAAVVEDIVFVVVFVAVDTVADVDAPALAARAEVVMAGIHRVCCFGCQSFRHHIKSP